VNKSFHGQNRQSIWTKWSDLQKQRFGDNIQLPVFGPPLPRRYSSAQTPQPHFQVFN
jgi:c-di-GMP-binding flagellar brake protein YcgR